MRKVFIGVLLLIIIAGVGAPFVSGLLMEKVVRESFGNLNTNYSDAGYDVLVEIVSYDRKFYTSEIEWKIKFGSLKTVYGTDEVIFVDRADHGYTGISTSTSLEKNSWFSDFINNKLAGKNPLTITNEYRLTGQITSTITLEPFSLPIDGAVAQIGAAKAVVSSDKELKKVSSQATWEGMTIADKVRASGIFANSDMEKMSTFLWDGTVSYGVKELKITGGLDQFELVNFKGDYVFHLNREKNRVSIATTLGVDQVQVGPEKMTDSLVRIGVNNIDAAGFENFMKIYTEMANNILKDISGVEDDPDKMKTIFKEQLARIQFQMLSAYEQLLKKGLEFEISDLHARLSKGEIKGDALLSLNKDMSFAQFVPLVQQPGLIFEILSLRSNLSIPAELVEDNPMLLSPTYPGMQTGLFVKEGDTLIHKAETREGKLYLNGHELVL